MLFMSRPSPVLGSGWGRRLAISKLATIISPGHPAASRRWRIATASLGPGTELVQLICPHSMPPSLASDPSPFLYGPNMNNISQFISHVRRQREDAMQDRAAVTKAAIFIHSVTLPYAALKHASWDAARRTLDDARTAVHSVVRGVAMERLSPLARRSGERCRTLGRYVSCMKRKKKCLTGGSGRIRYPPTKRSLGNQGGVDGKSRRIRRASDISVLQIMKRYVPLNHAVLPELVSF